MPAWSFDRAVQTFGGALTKAIQDSTKKTKNQAAADRKAQQTLDKWLSSNDTKVMPGRFRDPMATVRA